MDTIDVDRWYAIHCPLAMPAMDELLTGKDILISNESAGQRFSCRDFDNKRQRETNHHRNNAHNWVQSLLQRLGF